MLSYINKIALCISIFCLSSLANASLITNGSFEETTFSDGSTSNGAVFGTNLQSFETKRRAWDVYYNLPGWITSFGNGIELQKNVVTSSQDGSHHVELDSHPSGASNAVMTQTLKSLIIGSDYLLEFYYKPRTNGTNDNGINVFWYDSAVNFNLDMKTVLVADSTRQNTPNWIKKSVSFTAKTQSMNLSFASFGKQNTLGGLIDNVSLEQIKVPEPPMALLFFTAISILFINRYKKNNSTS